MWDVPPFLLTPWALEEELHFLLVLMFVSSRLLSLRPQSVSAGVADWPALGFPLDTERKESRDTKGRILSLLLRFMQTKQVKSGAGSLKAGLCPPLTGRNRMYS